MHTNVMTSNQTLEVGGDVGVGQVDSKNPKEGIHSKRPEEFPDSLMFSSCRKLFKTWFCHWSCDSGMVSVQPQSLISNFRAAADRAVLA